MDEKKPLGKILGIKHSINLTSDVPVVSHEYIVPIGQREELISHIKELEQMKIIQKSDSFYSSPAFTVTKKVGIRMVTDFIKINSITEHFTFPNVHKTFLDLKGATCFSQIDLKMGYYQLEIDEKDRHKTIFSIMGEKYEYLRLPFGMKNAPFVFQRVMQRIIGKFDFVKLFIDDILIYSDTKEQHLIHLEKVLATLNENNISINAEKNTFGAKEVKFLEQRVSKIRVKAEIGPIKKMDEIKTPTTKKHIMKIVGIIQWY